MLQWLWHDKQTNSKLADAFGMSFSFVFLNFRNCCMLFTKIETKRPLVTPDQTETSFQNYSSWNINRFSITSGYKFKTCTWNWTWYVHEKEKWIKTICIFLPTCASQILLGANMTSMSFHIFLYYEVTWTKKNPLKMSVHMTDKCSCK